MWASGRLRARDNMQTDVRLVGDILRRIESAENSGRFEDIAEMLADDAVIMVPNHPVQEGKAACAAFVCSVLTDVVQHFNRHITYTSAEARIIGDVAFDRGTFSFTIAPKSGGDTNQETGKYLFLYSRVFDGPWKIARAIVNLDERDDEGSDVPAQAPE
jgi:ketosteroid isomerase-like protein